MSPEEFIKRRWVTDGAMATYLFSKGASSPVEELNLTAPAMVAEVHREYLDAGAQIIRTNTFFSRRAEVNRAGVRIARAVAGNALVAGVIGSAGGSGTRELFRQHAEALDGVDLYILETFTSIAELRSAVNGVRDVTNSTLIAQVSVAQDGRLHDGSVPEVYGPMLNALAADAIGFNCSFSPESILAAFERVRAVTDKPMSACPNTGLKMQLSPEHMAAYTRRFLDAGALVVGTCCGSTPEYVGRAFIPQPAFRRL